MPSINFKREIPAASLDDAIARVTAGLQKEGFGVLTRIDMHAKFKEKLGKDIRPVVILGACNPQLAFEAYSSNTDVSSLLPCNAVVRDLGGERYSIELAKPSAMMEMLGDRGLVGLAGEADARLERVLKSLA